MADVPEGGDAQGDVAHGAAEEPWQGKERAEELFPAWLSRHRVSVPEPPVRHLVRPDLLQRCMPTNQRVTLLQAGGGFGKTTLLAECCRTLRARGVPTAWLSLDERDDPVLLDNYLALAFQHAGIDVLGPLRSENTDLDVPSHRTALLARAMETHPGPCVLVLDELERVRDPRSVALLNSLLQSNPDGLHVALACRELPVGLDVGTGVLSGQAALLTTEDMRFSRAEIAQFFDERLSGRELSRITKDSAGWPIALRMRDNEGDRAATGVARVMRNVVGNWVGSRLLYDLSDEDRNFVLDAGLFDWIDGDLLDEALQQRDSMGRLEAVAGLQGLLEPVWGKSGVRRLHGRRDAGVRPGRRSADAAQVPVGVAGVAACGCGAGARGGAGVARRGLAGRQRRVSRVGQPELEGSGGVGMRAVARAARERRLCRRTPVRGRVGEGRSRARPAPHVDAVPGARDRAGGAQRSARRRPRPVQGVPRAVRADGLRAAYGWDRGLPFRAGDGYGGGGGLPPALDARRRHWKYFPAHNGRAC